MKESLLHTIDVKECGETIPLAAELLTILDLPTEWVLWKKTETEYYLFSEKQWNIFVYEMKQEKWMTAIQYEHTREGRNFMRHLYIRAGTVNLKNKKIYLPRHTRKKLIQQKDFTIHVYR